MTSPFFIAPTANPNARHFGSLKQPAPNANISLKPENTCVRDSFSKAALPFTGNGLPSHTPKSLSRWLDFDDVNAFRQKIDQCIRSTQEELIQETDTQAQQCLTANIRYFKALKDLDGALQIWQAAPGNQRKKQAVMKGIHDIVLAATQTSQGRCFAWIEDLLPRLLQLGFQTGYFDLQVIQSYIRHKPLQTANDTIKLVDRCIQEALANQEHDVTSFHQETRQKLAQAYPKLQKRLSLFRAKFREIDKKRPHQPAETYRRLQQLASALQKDKTREQFLQSCDEDRYR